MIPYDPNGAWYTSGLRLGTPAMTTLGMGARGDAGDRRRSCTRCWRRREPAAKKDGQPSQVKFETDPKVVAAAKARVADLLARHPLYPGIELE